MGEIKLDHECDPKCEEQQVAVSGETKQEVARDDSSLAVLIAIVPLLVFTFFGQVGLL